ncbi:MAG: ATP-grasp domain-containing protein [Firmicutes bacterium]|nr:ATP-grasp domain-containing protein [Bacillota bacterium]
MKNFVFISPNFPTNYWMFCRELKNNGLNVLGIGECPYDELTQELRDSLNEYYKVNSLENEDEVFRAVAFFSFKYGKIDWLESNNEYWLENDANLRTEFNITSGFKNEDMARIKYKSGMKAYYEKAGIPVARYHMVDTLEGCKKFIKEVGYPVITKPDNGVGASLTYRIENDAELDVFFSEKDDSIQFIMEEYIFGEICSYDAIINSKGEPLFESGNVTVLALVDVVNNATDSIYYIQKNLPEDVKKYGRAAVKSFEVKSRFVHFEFFRLQKDQKGLGKKGEVVALEVNMRPSGGNTPDMLNFANSTNVYKIFADMIAFDKTEIEEGEHYYCAFIGLRDGLDHVMSRDEIRAKYADSIKMDCPVSDALSGAMGNYMFLINFSEKEDMDAFYKEVTALK